jgi:hypothetical protein
VIRRIALCYLALAALLFLCAEMQQRDEQAYDQWSSQ